MRAVLARIDNVVLKAEAVLCVVFLATMSVLVFLDVVHRVAATPGGRLFEILRSLLGGTEASDSFLRDVAAPILIAGLWFGIMYAAIRTAKKKTATSPRKAAVVAAVATCLLGGVVKLYVWLLPNGIVWAQPVALAMMLWTGFLGASIATKVGAHISLEVMEFAIPKRAKPFAAGLGNGVAAVFSAFFTVISWLFAVSYYDEWSETDGLAGTIEGVPIPKFVIYAVLPISFSIMTARFAARALTGLSGHEPPKPEEDRPRDAAGEGSAESAQR